METDVFYATAYRDGQNNKQISWKAAFVIRSLGITVLTIPRTWGYLDNKQNFNSQSFKVNIKKYNPKNC